MPGGFPIDRGRSPGVVLVPGVGASFLGVGVLDFRLGVDDLSFCNRDYLVLKCTKSPYKQIKTLKCRHINKTVSTTKVQNPVRVKNTPTGRKIQSDNLSGRFELIQSNMAAVTAVVVIVCQGEGVNHC